jgi:alpha,alpha-trehalose phosphorylase
MIRAMGYHVAPWTVREAPVSLARLTASASVFALSNGYLGIRGALDESEPRSRGTFLNGFAESVRLCHSEPGFGYPDTTQVLLDVAESTSFTVAVDGWDLDLHQGTLHRHERELDLRDGTLTRGVEVTSPAGRRVHLTTRRIVSMTHRHLAVMEYTLRSVSHPVEIKMTSRLVVGATPREASAHDPRAGTSVPALEPVHHSVTGDTAILTHRTAAEGRLVSAGMHHAVVAPSRGLRIRSTSEPNAASASVSCRLEPGQELRLTKWVAYSWDERVDRVVPERTVAFVLGSQPRAGFAALLREQGDYLDSYWAAVDLEVDGDLELQQAVRFALFQLLQATAGLGRRGIPAKGLTGTGYDGHTFWDSEGFVVPVLMYLRPEAAKATLRWRADALDSAQQRAGELSLQGAAFPWRTIDGRESSGYWPAGTAAFHINAVIADAFDRYRRITGDESLEGQGGCSVLVATARLWADLGTYDTDGRFHIHGVTGPDEYSALQDDNLFTNVMAARNLRAAAAAVHRNAESIVAEKVTDAETESWRRAARAMHLPYSGALGVHEQSAGFTTRPEWDFEADDRYPLMMHHHYVNLYRRQVVKQADLILAMHWCSEMFTATEKARNFDYYERRTARDSSLSAPIQAVLAAELGHLQLAHDYAFEAATSDLRDLHGNTAQGLHVASMAAAWTALTAGFGGMRDHEHFLSFDPVLPPALTGLRFNVVWRGMRTHVAIRRDAVTYTRLDDDNALMILRHRDELLRLGPGTAVTRPIEARRPVLPPPTQPRNRAPERRLPIGMTALDPEPVGERSHGAEPLGAVVRRAVSAQ